MQQLIQFLWIDVDGLEREFTTLLNSDVKVFELHVCLRPTSKALLGQMNHPNLIQQAEDGLLSFSIS